MRRAARGLFSLAVLASLSLAIAAAADGPPPSKSDCVAASLAGQRARGAGHLTAAKASFATCGDAACPALVRNDCTRWTDELLSSIPTVVFGAQDSEGHDLSDVRVLVDGALLTGGVAGQAVPVDPGTHVVRYERADGGTVEQPFVLREGEKRRVIVLRFPATTAAPAATAPAVAATASQPPAEPSGSGGAASAGTGRENVIAGAVTGVGGLALVGLGVYFFTQQSSETSSLEKMCAGGACRPGTPAVANLSSQVTTVNTNRALTGASWGVGAAALGAAVYFLVARPLGHESARPAPIGGLLVSPTPGGMMLGYDRPF
jgi:hypothetical protein